MARDPARETASLAARLFDPMGEVADFEDTAALVAALDLVISVDTAVVHLAGALGRPVWVLSRHDACWRWLGGRIDNPWYPTLRHYGRRRRGIGLGLSRGLPGICVRRWLDRCCRVVQKRSPSIDTQRPAART